MPRRLRLHFDGDLIDLGGEDEIVFAQATDGVRPQFNGNVAIAFDVKIGVVTIFFGDLSDFVEERQPGHEVLDRPVFADPFSIVGEIPTVELGQLIGRFVEGARGDASFARLALLLRQLIGRLNIHGGFDPFIKKAPA